MMGPKVHWLVAILLLAVQCLAAMNRIEIVRRFNPNRNHSSHDTPMQVGNGNFAFGADVTGLQSIKPFNTLSSWGWHSSPPPPGIKSQIKALKRNGAVAGEGLVELMDCAWLHGKALIKGSLPDYLKTPQQQVEDIGDEILTVEEWQKRNPHRVNLGRIGLLWDGRELEPWEVSQVNQTLDLTTGILQSSFVLYNQTVEVDTVVSPLFDVVAFKVQSNAMIEGALQVFVDFPYPRSTAPFEAPYVGTYGRDTWKKHETKMKKSSQSADIKHTIDDTEYHAYIRWHAFRPLPEFRRRDAGEGRHRYVLNSTESFEVSMSVRFSQGVDAFTPAFDDVMSDSRFFWREYWNAGAFMDCSGTTDPRAETIQRRVVLSQYLMAVNAAGEDPPQDSGLVNNGWYGKFHMESAWWHLAHWERWNKWERIGTAIPYIYRRLLNASLRRAADKGFKGAKWGELMDSRGKTTDGPKEPFVWQEPHPFYFAEQEYMEFPNDKTLAKWKDILEGTAEFMLSFVKKSPQTGKYDLGPPLESLAGGDPASTKNPSFELAYWRFGLNVMINWYKRQSLAVPDRLSDVYNNLAPIPMFSTQKSPAKYLTSENDPYMWLGENANVSGHPAVIGIFGLLPPDPLLNLTVLQNTLSGVYSRWRRETLFGWDYPLLAMTAIRMGDSDRAATILAGREFDFDDVGMPVGKGHGAQQGGQLASSEEPQTPYFPSSGGLLMAVGMMASGWREIAGKHWPSGWMCEAEGFAKGI